MYIISGNPTPLARPRFSRGKVWDRQAHLKHNASQEISIQHGNLPLFAGPLHMDLVFYMPIAPSLPARTHTKIKGTYHIYKPDLDNLIKFAGDICNNVLFLDDALIASINARKMYDSNPRTEIIISPL